MTIATYLLSKLDFSATVHWLAGKFHSHQAPRVSPVCTSRFLQSSAINSVAHASRDSRATPRNASANKPLRVVRVVEQGQSRSHVGRMVISGRMADVCAELDRLAAGELA